jgi:hypothetical protein
MALMGLEVTRLLLGLLFLTFHRHIADYVMQHERVLVCLLRQRGVTLPSPSTETARNVYFALAAFVIAIEMARIWTLLHP